MASSTLIITFIFLLILYPPVKYALSLADLPADVVEPYKCQLPNSPFCNIESYRTVQPFNNTLGHTSIDAALAELHKYGFLFDFCRSKIQLFLCSLYLPVCVNTPMHMLLPCRDDCEEAKNICKPALVAFNQTWPEEWDCRRFNYTKHDNLCVIDNRHTDQSDRSRSFSDPPVSIPDDPISPKLDETITGVLKPPYQQLDTVKSYGNESCDDLFDCQIRDPSRRMKLLCVDPNWVCDGKKDCVLGDIGDGLDEKDCEKRCHEGQFYCDGKCINRSDICDGKVDCSLGTDEQDCYDYHAGLIQSVFCIFALFTAIYLLVGFFRMDDKKTDSTINDGPMHEGYCDPERILTPHDQKSFANSETIAQPVSVTPNRQFNQNLIKQLPIYQEPSYSGCNYERLNLGGNSSANSVYSSFEPYSNPSSVSYVAPHSRERNPLAPTPAAPPPTPVPPQIYSTGSMNKSIDLYGLTMHDPHKLIGLDD